MNWTLVPCATVHATASEAVKSKWPLQVLGLYLFAFRGADLEMLALASRATVSTIAIAIMAAAIVAAPCATGRHIARREPMLDPVPKIPR